MNPSRHGALLSRGFNVKASSRSREAFDKLVDVVDSDSSIEIIEGNLFADKATKETVKKPKPIHPFFMQQSKRQVTVTSSQKSNEVSKHDEKPHTECFALRVDNILQNSLNHTNTVRKEVSRRGILKKQVCSDIDRGRRKESENSINTTTVRTPEKKSGLGKNPKDAEANSSMPTYSFADYCAPSPAVVYTRCEDEANRLVQTLESPLGFDLEWRVLWHSGAQERRTALVQLCDKSTILLIQVSHMNRFPQKVWDVIESPSIIKTGANILKDGEKLYRDFGIIARGLAELAALAHFADDAFSGMYKRQVVSLAKMTAYYLKCNLVKGKERTSNWEGDLNDKMVLYAANDVHAGLMVHLKLLDLASVGNKEIEPFKYTSSVDPQSVGADKIMASPASGAPNFPPEPPRPQYMRAYNLWHHHHMPLDKMCDTLKTKGRVEPLKESTVISYVMGAIQADRSLPFDMGKLLELIRMEAGSWQRHRVWLVDAERSGHGRAVLLE